jgi:MOSC domain-containing protein YiiM
MTRLTFSFHDAPDASADFPDSESDAVTGGSNGRTLLKPLVTGIFTAPTKGAPMVESARIMAVIGLGLFMDRYATGQGTYSKSGKNPRQITLIHSDCLAEGNKLVREPYTAAETRRNLLVEGNVDLLQLIGKDFFVGPVRMRGVEECLPCKIPSRMYRKDDFVKAFAGKGGIRAEVLSTGFVSLRDELHW